MWNPIRNRRLKRDWRLVSTFKFEVNWVNTKGDSLGKKDTVFYYLKENGLGERKCVHEGTGDISGKYMGEKRETLPLYLESIRPWLAGRYDPDIPNYESIKAKEFKDALAGKIT